MKPKLPNRQINITAKCTAYMVLQIVQGGKVSWLWNLTVICWKHPQFHNYIIFLHNHTNYFTGKLSQLPINQQKSQNFSTSNDLQYVTGFWKTNQIVTLALFNFIGLANSYMHTLPILIVITRLGWLVCFSRASIATM